MSNKENKFFKQFKIVNIIELAASLLFSILCFSYHADISLLALPLALIFTLLLSYYFFVKIAKNTDGKYFNHVVKMTSYLPYVNLIAFVLRRAGKYGTSYAYDLITVLLWLVIFITALISGRMTVEKRAKKLCEGWSVQPNFKKPKGRARFVWEIFDWIDAIVWALCSVLLVQIFIFQLYAIPSESMVPTFLVKDRVAVSKLDCGPKFPLTDVGLPDFRKYKRGDTIVLRNPHYSIDRKSEVKSVTSQLIYMLTLMQVNINRDEQGNPKADPLVKRICGLPGEQLVMQDGTLYTRTNDSDEWKPAEMDQKYACWNLSAVKSDLLPRIQTFPLSGVEPSYNMSKQRTNTREVVASANEEYQEMLDFEELRRNYDLDVAMFQSKEIVSKLSKYLYKTDASQTFEAPELWIYNLFFSSNLQDITKQIMTQDGGYKWFSDYMTSWISAKNNNRDMYAESNFRLNVMSKIYFGNLVLRYAELMYNDVSATLWTSDEIIKENTLNAQTLVWYVQMLLDSRNMCVFPASDSNGNPNYIPKDCYFMMGDNRFNSLDLRHSDSYSMKYLTEEDSYSVKYQSILAPQHIHKKYVIGKPVFRFWPLDRMSRIR